MPAEDVRIAEVVRAGRAGGCRAQGQGFALRQSGLPAEVGPPTGGESLARRPPQERAEPARDVLEDLHVVVGGEVEG